MIEFRILQNCSTCGEGFYSKYELLKHKSKVHQQPEKAGWMGGDEDSCSCGSYYAHQDG